MILHEVWRLASKSEATLGIWYMTVEGRRTAFCWTLEDQHQRVKVPGEARVPPGTYKLALRSEGGFHERYKARFPLFHRGMIWLQDVPGFDFVLVHCGNTDQETKGCILVGYQADLRHRGTLAYSQEAYELVYPVVAGAIGSGEDVRLRVTDVDTP